jgi:YL1 nuclear protein/YL1 nuclear protein C-terminal domain
MSAPAERSRRSTAGKRMGTLVGKAQEEDDAFWGHDTWADDPDDSENGSFRSSDEDSEAKKDQFDSDFNDSETDGDEADADDEGAAQDKLLDLQTKRDNSKKRMHADISKAGRDLMGKKKVKGKNIAMGEGLNAGIVLHFPGAVPFAPAFTNKAPATVGTASLVGLHNAPPAMENVATQQIPPVPAVPVVPVVPSLPKKPSASRRTTRSHRRTLRHSTKQAGEVSKKAATVKDKETGRAAEKAQMTKSKHKRLYTQGELLLEAVHETEPENERWLLGRKRLLDKVEQDKERQLHQQQLQGSKVVERFHSRRGYLNTINFPNMDHVPAILTMQPKVVPPPPRLCVITGLKARYRCPLTQLGYYDLKAFRELRRRHKAGEPLEQRESRPKEECDNETETRDAAMKSATTISSSLSHTKPAKPSSVVSSEKKIKASSSPGGSRKRSKLTSSPKAKPVVAKASNGRNAANASTVDSDTPAPPAVRDSLADANPSKGDRSSETTASANSVTVAVKSSAKHESQLPVKESPTRASTSKQSNSKKQQNPMKASNAHQQQEIPTASTAQKIHAATEGGETKQIQVAFPGKNVTAPRAASAAPQDATNISQASSPLQTPKSSPMTAGKTAPRHSPKSSPTASQPAVAATLPSPSAAAINPAIASVPLHHQYPMYTHPYVHSGAAYTSYPYHLQYPPAAYHHPQQTHNPASTYAPYGYPVYAHLHPGAHGHALSYQTPSQAASNIIGASSVVPVATAAAVLVAATTVLAASLAMPSAATTVTNIACGTAIAPEIQLPAIARAAASTVPTPAASDVVASAPSVASVVAPAAAEVPPPPQVNAVSSPQRKSPRKRKPTERALQAQLTKGAPYLPPFPDS